MFAEDSSPVEPQLALAQQRLCLPVAAS